MQVLLLVRVLLGLAVLTPSGWGEKEHKDQLKSSHQFLMVNRDVGVSLNEQARS